MSSTLSNKITKLNRTLSKKSRYRGITKLQLHQRSRQRIAQQKASENTIGGARQAAFNQVQSMDLRCMRSIAFAFA